jgi:HK97 family phage major capsid protein/HK97 family phage prohead protease
MKLKEVFRSTAADVSNVDDENRTMDLTFSSEAPVDQYFGREILSHAPGAADLSTLKNGAPLLWNHDKSDIRGVVENAHIGKDKRGHATVRFSKSAKGEEAFQDAKDKIIRGVSVGYRIKSMKQSGGDRANPEYTIDKWHPTEISLAPVPADSSVGIGRAASGDEQDVAVEFFNETPVTPTRKDPPMTTENVAAQAVTAERARIATITALGAKFGKADLARKLIDEAAPLDAARNQFLEALGGQERAVGDVTGAAGYIDASVKELKSYSLIRALNAAITKDWTKAGFELECSAEIQKRAGRDGTNGFFLPMNIPTDTRAAEARRMLGGERTTSATAYGATVNTGQGGGNLVATNLLAGSFIEVLRAKARVMSLGARMLSGLVGNVAIPRQDTATASYWVSPEGADVTEAEAVFDLVSMTPHTIGARSQITRQMLMQSTPDIEMLVRDDLAAVLGLGIDLAAISGTGADGQPTGILNRAGIGSVALGTNGGPITIDALIALETSLMTQNVDENDLNYLTNARQVGALKTLKDTNGRYLWTQYPGVFGQRTPTPGEINGYPVARSNQVPSDLTKGTGTGLSAVIFANWSELFIGEWGVLEILPNPYGAGFNSGSVDIRALQSVDINLRHVASFAAITDAA